MPAWNEAASPCAGGTEEDRPPSATQQRIRAEHDHYRRRADDDTLTDAERAVAREQVRRLATHYDRQGRTEGDTTAPSAWAHIPLAPLFERAGNAVYERRDGTFETGHAPLHTSSSGRCVTIDPSLGLWYCRSCRRGGTAVHLTMDQHGVGYTAAVGLLVETYGPPPGTAPPEPGRRYRLTDVGNARRLIDRERENILYCAELRSWLVWNGQVWEEDRRGAVVESAKATAQSIYHEAAVVAGRAAMETDADCRTQLSALAGRIESWARASESARGIEAMVSLARSIPGVTVLLCELDANPWILNTQNGSVDLRTGTLRRHSRNDRLTKLTPVRYDSKAQAPTWERFLRRTFATDNELIAYVQRAAGYAATACTDEQVLFFLYGLGANGKSCFLGALRDALGPYAMSMKFSTFVAQARGQDSGRFDQADLLGARLVTAIEAGRAVRFDEQLLKSLTGDDPIRAERKYKDAFEFLPSHTLFLAANHKPALHDTSLSMWRRVRLLPFTTTIPPEERDPHLAEKLRAEAPGILAWIVRGCLAWQDHGLGAALAVDKATAEYRAEQDVLADFLEACCILETQAEATAADLYETYIAWADAARTRSVAQRTFGTLLTERGLVREKRGGVHRWRGVRLIGAPDVPPDDTAPAPAAGATGGPEAGADGKRPAASAQASQASQAQPGPRRPVSGNSLNARAREPSFPGKGPDGPDTAHLLEENPPISGEIDGPAMGLISQKFIPPMGGSHGERNGPGDAPADFVSSLPTGLLNTVQQRAGNDPVSAPKTPPFPEKEVFISNVEGVRSVIEACAAVPRIGFDTETTGLDPRTDRLCLIQLATGEHTFLIDALAVDLALLRPVFEGTAELAGFNLVFDIQMLHAAGLTVTAPLFDCMLAAQILEARGNARPDEPKRPSRRKGDYDLVHVAARYLGETVSKDEQQSNWRARPLSSEQLAYAARDAEVVLRLADVLHTRLVDGDLVPTATLDFSIVPQLAEMQLRGCPFDLAAWRALSDAALADTLAAEEAMRALLAAEMPDDPEAQPWTPPLGKRGKPLKRKPPVPVWSSTMSYKGRPSRLTALLRRRGHQVDATDDVVLVQIAEHDRFVQLLRDWRDATTRSGRYGITWPAGHADEAAGRIYATFWQCWAETGRLSSDKPNLQNIPGNPAYRRCFRAAPGKLLVRADYSQIELVITAVISQDATMLATLAAGGDLHCLTASRVLGVPEDAVTDAQRQLAKNLNFGLLFGMGPAALVEYLATRGIASTLKEATRFHARFHLTYEGLDRWQHAWGNGQGETRSLYGRRRLDVRKYTERLNSPVQCSGADLIKDALRRLWEDRASAPSARIVNAVHDEILAECGADDAPAVEAWLRGHMLAAGQAMLPSMPPRVESSIGPDWTKHPKAAQQGAGAKESSR